MVLIDALYINGGGAKVLLDYLISELESREMDVLYLLDKRIENLDFYRSEKNKFIFLEATLSNRHRFYKNRRKAFSAVLCLGNLPPSVRLDAQVYTFFHQLLYLELPGEMPFVKKRVYKLKTVILNHFKRNTDSWIVQTHFVKAAFGKKYGIPAAKILELPFFPPFVSTAAFERKKNQYIYISNATPHKNHWRLLEAFCRFYDEYKTGTLIVTVSDEYPEVVRMINAKIEQHYPIKNIGFVERESLQQLYAESEFLIFPSLSESFGLGLIEAVEGGCNIIGADLPYTYAVCEPSIIFNPLDINSIVEAFRKSTVDRETLKKSQSKVRNRISDLVALLTPP